MLCEKRKLSIVLGRCNASFLHRRYGTCSEFQILVVNSSPRDKPPNGTPKSSQTGCNGLTLWVYDNSFFNSFSPSSPLREEYSSHDSFSSNSANCISFWNYISSRFRRNSALFDSTSCFIRTISSFCSILCCWRLISCISRWCLFSISALALRNLASAELTLDL